MTGKADARARRAESLCKDLQRVLRLAEAKEVEALAAAGELAVMARPALLVAGHFVCRPDLTVYDPVLGTLGLVHVLDARGEELEAELRRAAEHAAFVRHLALTRPRDEPGTVAAQAENGRQLPLTVELVVAVPGDESVRASIGRALREIARTANYLHGIGVNVLEYEERPKPGRRAERDRRIRRAFCWLLTATRAWYDTLAAKATMAATVGGAAFGGLALSNWRLAGGRRLELSGEHAVHLLHGSNGAGKSTLVEVLELAMTGRIGRLLGDWKTNRDAYSARVAEIVVHHAPGGDQPSGPATATLTGAVGWTWTTGTSLPDPLAPAFGGAAAFRLDQPVMDRLAASGNEQRAALFLDAFFPEEKSVLDRYDAARVRATRSLAALPKEVLATFDAGADGGRDGVVDELAKPVRERLSWLSTGTVTVNGELEAILLPLPADDLRALAPLDREIAPALDRLLAEPIPRAALTDALQGLDRVLQGLRRRQGGIAAALDRARQILQSPEIAEWRPDQQASVGNYAEVLNSWLEAAAMADLAQRQSAVRRTLRRALGGGWQPDRAEGGVFRIATLDTTIDRELDEQAKRWTEEADKRLQAVMGFTGRTEAAGPRASGPRGRRPYLGPDQIAALDEVTRWLLPEGESLNGAQRLLGQAIAEAIGRNAVVPIGRNRAVGGENWTSILVRRIDSLSEALHAFQTTEWNPAGRRLEAMQESFDAFRELSVAGEAVANSFLDRILPMEGKTDDTEEPALLQEALSELVALFTPARWAYGDLRLVRRRNDQGRQELALHHGDLKDGDLRLNTAELNLFTVALFLLCAPRLDNPLRLLVLDDPLQNMDELTVTVLARGLSKLVERLPGWQLLLLFHGEDDLERFRRELPAAVYRLPWLSVARAEAATPEPIRHRPTNRDVRRKRQPAAGFLTDADEPAIAAD